MKDLIEKIDLYLKKVKRYLDNNKSFVYVFMLGFIILGYGFFFNSNAFIKNENKKSFTTSIAEIKTIGDYNIQVRSRKYSPTSNTVEFYVYCENTSNFAESKLQFELREQNNPLEIIETNVRRLDKNNYIVRAKVHKNWTVLSLGVGEFVEENVLDSLKNPNQEESQNKAVEMVKFYVERNDIESVLSLKERTANEYLSDGIDIEIDIINEKIKEETKGIEEKNINIKTLEENIKKLKEEQVYQTEIEISDSNNKINSIQDAIKTLNIEIEDSNKKIKEFKNKIQKLQEKKADYLKK